MKKLICAALALTLLVTPALGAGSFPAVNTYAGFNDVKESDWFYEGVKTCYEAGVMNGTGNGSFSPGGTITVAEVAAIAARLLESSTGQAIPGVTPLPGETLPWYQQYVGYLTSNGVAVPDPTRNATRQEFFDLLSAVTDPEQLPAINSITSLPDTGDANVLAFYNAGILTGVDAYGTFAGDRTLTRSEAAAMVSRVVRSELRLEFVPQELPVDEDYAQYGGVVMTVNGSKVLEVLVVNCMNELVYYNDYNIYQATGRRLDWNTDYGVGDLKTFFRNAAIQQAIRIVTASSKEQELGCISEEFPEKLVPTPERSVLEQYARDNDLLCAKHILVSDTDTAQAVIGGLDAVPTLDQFNALLTVFGTDPGMTSNPDGYLFTAGEMVSEFEAGVRALDFGAYSPEPVQSQFGYHVIWRLDPADHPDLLDSYRLEAYNAILDQWVEQAEIVVTDQAALDSLDPQACYEAFLDSLSSDGAG